MGILLTTHMGFLFTITMGILFTIVLGIQFTISNSIMTTALLDRLLHHARIFNLDGESYRIKNQKKEV